MTSLQPFVIAGSDIGLKEDIKPYLLPEKAFSSLDNAYVWRERVRKREGFEFVGRLRRSLTAVVATPIDLVLASPNSFNLFTLLGLLATEPNACVQPGTALSPITIIIGAQTLTDATGTGVLTIAPAGNITGATINYATGIITLVFTVGALAQPVTITMNYFPSFPVMGIWQRDQVGINDEETLFFDQKYCYSFNGTTFNEYIPGTTWDGSDSDFFWVANYRGSDASFRLFFVTNFVNDAANPMRYTDGLTWTDFTPQINNTPTYLLQARILIPYYGRLLALNTWEGAALGGGSNYFNRCRFSQIGSPIEAYNFAANPQTGAWAEDIFGKGGFIDAPTNEEIISAAFIKNTLIVFFERSTWQLRYVGEYGLPFLWERVSSDFGSESTFSTVLFDNGVLGFGDRAIISASPVTADRIDNPIPDLVFSVLNDLNGVKRVCGIRDFQKELVFWCYPDSTTLQETQYFPNKVLVYNYKNNTFEKFDDNITFFGTLQPTDGITWGRDDIFWEDEGTLWGSVNQQNLFPRIVAGNQQGFIGYYGYVFPDEQSMTITSFDTSVIPNQITVINHNLQGADPGLDPTSGEIIKIAGALFSGADPGLNGNYYKVQYIDNDTIALYVWDGTTFGGLDLANGNTYVGSGSITVFPKLNIMTKDFNPYLMQGNQIKISYIDFLLDATARSAISVNLFVNSSLTAQGNLIVGNKNVSSSLTTPFYVPASDYAWHRFYATAAGQFVRIQITYDDALMTNDNTHASNMVLNAYTIYVRTGGKLVF